VSVLNEEELRQYTYLKALSILSLVFEPSVTQIKQKDIKGRRYITAEDLDSILETLGLIDRGAATSISPPVSGSQYARKIQLLVTIIPASWTRLKANLNSES
jgi:hypothetical protein